MKGKKFLGMFSLALGVTMIVVVYCDLRNPMMNFLVNNVARIYIVALSLCAAAEGVALMVLSERATRCEEEKKAASRRMAAEQSPAPEPTPEVEEESWEDILEEVRR